MTTRLLKTGLASVAMLSTLALAQTDKNFQVYGFMDTQTEIYDLGNPFLTQFLGSDDIDLYAGHANVYFDWRANSQVKALLEVNFLGSKNINSSSQAVGPAELSYNGNKVTDAQFIGMIEAGIRAQFPAGTPASYVDSVVQASTASLPSVLQSIRQGTYQASQRSSERRAPSVERAYFDVSFSDQLNLRAGKFITPAGIWNVDHGSPVVLTVRQPIQTTLTPIFPESQTGVMVSGRYFLGDHDLDYAVYGTTGRDGASNDITASFNNSTDDLSDLSAGGHLGIRLDYLDGIRLGTSGMMGKVREKYQVVTPVLDAEEIATILTTSTSQSEIMSGLAALSPMELEFSDEYVTNLMEYVGGLDAKVDVAGFTTQGELNYRYRSNRDGTGYSSETWGMYGLLAYKLPLSTNVSLTPYTMAERVVFRNNGGDLGPVKGFNTYIGGLNFGLFTNVRIKTEVDYFQFLRNNASDELPSSLTDDDLTAMIYNVQLSVAF